jgi:hypothetical protein
MQSRLFNPIKVSLSTHSTSISTSESNSSPETNLKLVKQNSLRNPSLIKNNKILNSNQNSTNIDILNHLKNETQQTTSVRKLGSLNSSLGRSNSTQQQQPTSSISVFKNQVNLYSFA